MMALVAAGTLNCGSTLEVGEGSSEASPSESVTQVALACAHRKALEHCPHLLCCILQDCRERGLFWNAESARTAATSFERRYGMHGGQTQDSGTASMRGGGG